MNDSFHIDEEWKDIVGYEGLYQVSNLGNVRSLDRYIVNCRGIKRKRNGNLLTKKLQGHNYYYVFLTDGVRPKKFYVHRLVAMMFVENPNPSEFKEVNHIDEDKQNNCASNLEWVSRKMNCNTSNRKKKLMETPHHRDGVICDGKEFATISECARYYNIPTNTMICWVCGHSQMPNKWIGMGLRYKGEEMTRTPKLNSKGSGVNKDINTDDRC